MKDLKIKIFGLVFLFLLSVIFSSCGNNGGDKSVNTKEVGQIENANNEQVKLKEADSKRMTKKNSTKEEDLKKGDKKGAVPSSIKMNLAEKCKGATIVTNFGEIKIKFYGHKAPLAVANFCTLAEKDFYNDVKFHRVIKDFMIQGGDPKSKKEYSRENVWGTGGPGYRFADELPAPGEYKLGSVAMANSGKDTNGSQFFIVSGPAGISLPPKYSLFGEVVEGMDVVNKIQNLKTDVRDRPVEDVIIKEVRLQLSE